jgi:serine/threonine protein kinase
MVSPFKTCTGHNTRSLLSLAIVIESLAGLLGHAVAFISCGHHGSYATLPLERTSCRRRAFAFSSSRRAPTTRHEMVKWPSMLPNDKKGQQQKASWSNTMKEETKLEIGPRIGSGSYGTVHFCSFVEAKSKVDASKEEAAAVPPNVMVCKRAWREDEIASSLVKAAPSSSEDVDKPENDDGMQNNNLVRKKKRTAGERAQRCQHFLSVEQHCFKKLQQSNNVPPGSSKQQIPQFWGSYKDTSPQENEWLVFELRKRGKHKLTHNEEDDGADLPQPAALLADAMYTDWKKQHGETNDKQQMNGQDDSHHLDVVQQELGLPKSATFGDTLDAFFISLLTVISDIHDVNIVHRDLKPANLLLDRETQVRPLELCQSI